jgi:hypothetical protein
MSPFYVDMTAVYPCENVRTNYLLVTESYPGIEYSNTQSRIPPNAHNKY